MENQPVIVHRAGSGRYEWQLGDEVAYIEYTERDGVLALTRTFVPESLAGQGIAGRMTEAVMSEIAAHGLKIEPCCSYIVHWLERHPEWKERVADTSSPTPSPAEKQ